MSKLFFLCLVLFFVSNPVSAEITYTVREIDDTQYYEYCSRQLETTARGFGGEVDLKLLLDKNLNIIDLDLQARAETPRYRERVKEWIGQFEGQNIKYFADESREIDTLTGATVTSGAARQVLRDTARVIKQRPPGVDFLVEGRSQALVFLLFTAIALLLFYFNKSMLIRKFYLLSVVIVLGGVWNLQFAFNHIWQLLNLKLPVSGYLPVMLIFFVPLLLALLYGRFYCGWLCPFGALQELLPPYKNKLEPQLETDQKFWWMKFVLLVLGILGSFAAGRNVYIADPLSEAFIFYRTPWSDSLLLILAVLASLFILRFWCRYFCVTGAFLSLFNKTALFGKKFRKKFIDCDFNVRTLRSTSCIQCERCMYEKSENPD